MTQRPDTEDAIPGAVRDMLEDRIILGFVSGTGARMVLEKDWQAVTDEYCQAPVPGRGLARITGRLVRMQSFRLDPPREHPELEVFYPSKIKDGQQQPASNASQSAHGEGKEFQSGTLRTTESRWAPARPPEDADMGAAADDERIPPNGVPIYPPSPTPKGPPHSGQRHTS